MIPTSQKFQDEIRAPIRDVYAKIQIDYSDPELDQSIEITTSDNARISYPKQVADGVENVIGKIASLDGSWELGEYILAPTTELEGQMGWWGTQLSNSNGNFSSPYPTLIATFISRPIWQLKVVGDNQRGEYPVNFTIRLYDASNNLKYTETVNGNTKVRWTKALNPTITDVAKMVLTITKWSHAGRQAKIAEFITSIQETYEGEDIISINLIEEKEVSHGSLPVGNISSNEIEIKLNNESRKFDTGNRQSPLYGLVKANRKIRAWIGTESELVPLGVFWSRDWTVPEDGVIASTKGRDRLDRLNSTTYTTSTVQINKSMYDLAKIVLEDAQVPTDYYWLDDELKDYIVPYAYFEQQSHREALRKIAEACLGQVYCDRNGIIRFEGPSYTLNRILEKTTTAFLQSEHPAEFEVIDAYGISPTDYFKKDNPSRQSDIANRVIVEVQPLTVGAVEEVYSSSEAISIAAGETKTVNIQFNNVPCMDVTISLSGTGTITDSKIYAWGAEVTVSSAIAGSFTLSAYGKPLKTTKYTVIKQDDISIADNGVIEFTMSSNPLIQTQTIAETIADKLLQYYKNPRRDLELEWRGNPALTLGDIIMVDDYTRGNGDEANKGYYYITKQELEYAGYLRAKLSGRRAL
ncbi:MAG TPA: hypothetical protein GXX36_03385 [Clostridiaceae bacterium]|nr:hypothetical protein [Clostridiaceae bacterium]